MFHRGVSDETYDIYSILLFRFNWQKNWQESAAKLFSDMVSLVNSLEKFQSARKVGKVNNPMKKNLSVLISPPIYIYIGLFNIGY